MCAVLAIVLYCRYQNCKQLSPLNVPFSLLRCPRVSHPSALPEATEARVTGICEKLESWRRSPCALQEGGPPIPGVCNCRPPVHICFHGRGDAHVVVEGGHCGGCINEAAEEDAACWDRLCRKGQLPDHGEDGPFGACPRCSHRREFLEHGCQLLIV